MPTMGKAELGIIRAALKHPSWDVKSRRNWRLAMHLWEQQEEIRQQRAANRAWVESWKKRAAKARAERAERAEREAERRQRDCVLLQEADYDGGRSNCSVSSLFSLFGWRSSRVSQGQQEQEQ